MQFYNISAKSPQEMRPKQVILWVFMSIFPHTPPMILNKQTHLKHLGQRRRSLKSITNYTFYKNLCQAEGKKPIKAHKKEVKEAYTFIRFWKTLMGERCWNHASLAWQLRELLVSPNFMIITEYAYKLPPLNCLLLVGLGIQLLWFLIHEKFLLW